MIIEPTQSPRGRRGSRGDVWRLALASSFLILSTTLFVRFLASHDYRLIMSGQISSSDRFTENTQLYLPLFSVIELLGVSLLLSPRSVIPIEMRAGLVGQRRNRSLVWGLLTGTASLLVATPALLFGRPHSAFASFIINHSFDGRGLAALLLVLLLLPIASELFFRRILFDRLADSIPWVVALVLSALLFACLWPLFNPIAALILGVATAILLRRTGSLLACVVANSSFTLCGMALLVLRELYR